MKKLTRALVVPLAAAAVLAGGGAALASTANTGAAHAQTARSGSPAVKPTIVLVHGAFADSSSWTSEIGFLQAKGYTVVAAYIPDASESPADLTYKFPGSELTGSNLVERAEPGGTDIYINPADFGAVYAGGLSPAQTAVAAVTQRPITASALADPATVNPPASVPKWEIVALEDHAIPTQAEIYMANRAHATIVTTNSGHDVPAARPGVVDSVILQAVRSAS